MNVLAVLRIALKALRQNLLRTGLTMLGIVIGVWRCHLCGRDWRRGGT